MRSWAIRIDTLVGGWSDGSGKLVLVISPNVSMSINKIDPIK